MRPYWNPKQRQFFAANQPFKMFLAGRGAGKTSEEGLEQYQNMATMPRSRGFLAAATYGTLLNTTLPALTRIWENLGMVEGEDFVVGIKPPKSFEKSLDEPRRYENVISWANGRRVVLFSMDRPDLNRGGSYTDGALDEAALVPHDVVTRVLVPSLRGFVKDFQTTRRGQMRMYTSIPWKPSGYWTLDYEEKAKAQPLMYHFTEASAMDNLHAIGGMETIRRWEAEMPYLEFLIEVMNQRVKKAQNAFYHRFDADRHSYSARYLYDESGTGIITTGMADPNYKPDELLELSFDFSGYFNCAVAFQPSRVKDGSGWRTQENGLHQFFVKSDEGKVPELVDKIVEHYKRHRVKLVRLWGEPRGHDPKPDTPQTLFQQIQSRFAANGWGAEIKVQNVAVKSHKERANFMNDLLAEQTPTLPTLRLNDQTCRDAIIAMQVTETDETGAKNKANEKNRLFPQEHAPHFTDAIDYYLTQKHGSKRATMSRPALRAGVA